MKKRVLYIIFALLLAFAMPVTAFANADLPPFLTVIVENPPEDLELAVEIPPENFYRDQAAPKDFLIRPEVRAWETIYRFRVVGYNYNEFSLEGAKLVVTAGGNTFRCDIPEEELWNYDGFVSLDVKNQAVIAGTNPGRTVLLVLMRVSATLLLEGLIFLAFRMKKARSWIIFLAANLATQAWLNITLAGPHHNTYYLILVPIIEVGFFIVEAVIFSLFIPEFKEKQLGGKTATAFALLANLVSFIIGGIMLAYLPV